jgi:hypothetical protein
MEIGSITYGKGSSPYGKGAVTLWKRAQYPVKMGKRAK